MTLISRAQLAVLVANSQRRNHKTSIHAQRRAVKAVALVMLRENQKNGKHYSRQTVGVLRGS